MKIKLKLSPDTILALDSLFESFCGNPLAGKTKEQKTLLSIAYDLADHFQRLANRVSRSADLFSTKKKLDISLKYYQAWALERIIREMPQEENPYKKNLLAKTADELNQKLA